MKIILLLSLTFMFTVTVSAQEGDSTELPPIARAARGVSPAYIYAIATDGTLQWFRHDGAQEGKFDWQGPRDVGVGWDKYKFVFPGGGNVIYAVTQDGILQWFKHDGFETGSGDSWEGPNDVGRGWGGLKQVFSTGDGVIYGITQDGTLFWYKHNGFLSGAGPETPGAWEERKNVGHGWESFRLVFSTGHGVIYAATQDGKLKWYKHSGYLQGLGLEIPGAWETRVELGNWGNTFKQLFSAGEGIIYGIEPDGKLTWSRHLSYEVGLFDKSFLPAGAFGNLGDNRNWQGVFPVGTGWTNLTCVFALLPISDPGGVLPPENRSRSTTRSRSSPSTTINPDPPPSRTPPRVRRAVKP